MPVSSQDVHIGLKKVSNAQVTEWCYIQEQDDTIPIAFHPNRLVDQDNKSMMAESFPSNVVTIPSNSVSSEVNEKHDAPEDPFVSQTSDPIQPPAAARGEDIPSENTREQIGHADVAALRLRLDQMQREMRREMADIRTEIVTRAEQRPQEEGPPLYDVVVAANRGNE